MEHAQINSIFQFSTKHNSNNINFSICPHVKIVMNKVGHEKGITEMFQLKINYRSFQNCDIFEDNFFNFSNSKILSHF